MATKSKLKYYHNNKAKYAERLRYNRKYSIGTILCHIYNGMKRRVAGKCSSEYSNSLYRGLELLDRTSFYTWAKEDLTFLRLLEYWQSHGFNRKDRPSIDRIDSTKGYSLGNIQWLTFSENCIKGHLGKKLGKYSYIKKPRT